MKWTDKELNVLLVTTNENGYTLICGMLAEIESTTLNLDWVETYAAGQKNASDNLHDACLVDYQLDQHNGVDFICEAINAGCQTPIILLTKQKNKEMSGR